MHVHAVGRCCHDGIPQDRSGRDKRYVGAGTHHAPHTRGLGRRTLAVHWSAILRQAPAGLVTRPGRLLLPTGAPVIRAAMVLKMINSVMLITDSSAESIQTGAGGRLLRESRRFGGSADDDPEAPGPARGLAARSARTLK